MHVRDALYAACYLVFSRMINIRDYWDLKFVVKNSVENIVVDVIGLGRIQTHTKYHCCMRCCQSYTGQSHQAEPAEVLYRLFHIEGRTAKLFSSVSDPTIFQKVIKQPGLILFYQKLPF